MFGNHTTLARAGRGAIAPCSIAVMLGACVPYPHSVTRNPAIEGHVLSAETGKAVANAKIELDIGSDESWRYATASDAEGRFAFAEHRDYRLFAMLADAPRCWTLLSVEAPGYRALKCGWGGNYSCQHPALKLELKLTSAHEQDNQKVWNNGFLRCMSVEPGAHH